MADEVSEPWLNASVFDEPPVPVYYLMILLPAGGTHEK
jgi:hypothetical protein